MEIQKSFVTHDQMATLCCPHCNLTKIINVKKYLQKKHIIKVRCKCEHTFTTLLDFRRHYRKETAKFEGTYSMLAPARGTGHLKVLNISQKGVGFNIGITVSGTTAFEVGQKARIQFNLDDKKKTPINKIVIIRNIIDNFLGCEFIDHNELDKSLGFYLRM